MSKNVGIVILSATTVGNGATITSSVYPADFASGFSAVFIQLAGSSNVTITQQGSIDGVNFYNPIDASGNALGAVCTALTSTAGVYVQFSPVVSIFNRLSILAGAASTVSMTLVMSEQMP